MTVKPVHVRNHLMDQHKFLFNPTEIRLEIINIWKDNKTETSLDVYSIEDPAERERNGTIYLSFTLLHP
jgi:hypothetical protein